MTNHEYDSYEIYATSHFLLLHEFFLLHDSIPLVPVGSTQGMLKMHQLVEMGKFGREKTNTPKTLRFNSNFETKFARA
jgi:hypothetical protein